MGHSIRISQTEVMVEKSTTGARDKMVIAGNRKKPLYRQIADTLRERILTEVWAPDEALPSRRALAHELSTTHITIDKAVSQLVKEGLLSATIGSGTYVNRRDAVVLPRHRNNTRRVGIVLGAQTFKPQETSLAQQHIYFGELLHGIQDGFFGCDVEVNYEGVMLSDDARLRDLDFDGLLVIAPSLFDLEAVRALSRIYSLVAIGFSSSMIPEGEKLPCVDTGNVLGGYLAGKHLIDLGHKKIGTICLSYNSANHFDRHHGFMKAMTEGGVMLSPEHILMYPLYFTQIPVERIIEPWIAHLKQNSNLPTAIFANDYTATSALLEYLEQHSINVPRDLSVVGYDDCRTLEYYSPPVTAVYQPTYELGRRAAERLLLNLDGAASSRAIGTEQLAPELRVRASTVCSKFK